jgi:hypothetical protein
MHIETQDLPLESRGPETISDAQTHKTGAQVHKQSHRLFPLYFPVDTGLVDSLLRIHLEVRGFRQPVLQSSCLLRQLHVSRSRLGGR